MVTEEEIKGWYDDKHQARGEGAWRRYDAYPVFLDYLKAESGRRLLDVGCGTGYLLEAAEQRGLETYGIDISEAGVEIARRVSPQSRIAVGRGEELEFPDEFFDYVTCLGSLEHFLDIDKGVQEMKRVCRNGGLLCIVVPNVNFVLWRLRGIPGTDQQDINEHLLSLEQWRDIFLRNGFEIVKVYSDTGFAKKGSIPSGSRISKLAKSIAYRVSWLVDLTFLMLPLNCSYQFIFIMRKK